MSAVRVPTTIAPSRRVEESAVPRRGRPRARDEILRAGRLGGVEPEVLAERFGTPIYVYDLDVVTRHVEALRRALPPSIEIAYAVKANPSLGVVNHLAGLGLGADVASGGELATALRAGIPAERIVMTGPGKRDDELRAAVRARIRAVTVESPLELRRLEMIAEAESLRVPILLRGAATAESRLERVRLVGDDGAGKFGMSADDLLASARRAATSPSLDLLGFHRFGASNVLDARSLVDHIAVTVAFGRELAAASGTRLRLVDVGGGLGIPYEAHGEPFDVESFGRHLTSLAADWAADPITCEATILLEPGRFLVGPAGAYVTRVVDRKSIDGSDVVILDGGVHHLLRPALVGQEHRVCRLSGAGRRTGRFGQVTVAGPLCSGLDVFATEVAMASPEVGDLVAVLDAGAYGFTESMPLFLSHPIPAEVGIRGGRAELLRPRREPETWLDEQRVPAW